MKKLFLFFTLLAGIVVMTGCQKDQDVVTLKAVIDPDTKTHFGGVDANNNPSYDLPYWDDNDQVRVIGGGYSRPLDCDLSDVSETYATVVGARNSSNNYYAAIYPIEAAEDMGIPIVGESGVVNGTTHAVVYFDPHQDYKETNGVQRVNMIMGAVTDNTTKTFHFKNLCSILRLNVENDYDFTVKVMRVTVQATGAYVAGSADVTLTPNGISNFHMDGLNDHTHDNVLSVYAPQHDDPEDPLFGTPVFIKTLAPGATATIDVVVPPFNASSLNIELELYKVLENESTVFLGNSDLIVTPTGGLEINKIATFDVKTSHGHEVADYAYLESGPRFHNHMLQLMRTLEDGEVIDNLTVRTINNDIYQVPSTAINVKDVYSPFDIWAWIDRSTGTPKIIIESKAKLIYAHKDCSQMFEGLTVSTMNWNNGYDPANPQGFQTEDVVDMSSMFKNCSNLTSIQGANFNTTNVRTMAHMFEGCSSISSFANLNISRFNTHNLQDMEAMFKGCRSLGSIDLSHFVTTRVSKMKELFSGCSSLQTITLSSNFTTAQVTDMSKLFNGCTALTSINLSSFTTNQVTDMSYFFAGCEHLTSINMTQVVISSGTNIAHMCDRLNYANPPLNANNGSRSPCYIICRRSTWNTMKGEATTTPTTINGEFNPFGTPDPTTGFTLTVIYDRDVFDDPTSK